MIDWRNGSVIKLSACGIEEVMPDLAPALRPDETVFATFKAFRDYLAVTNKRLIAVNALGVTGKRKDYTSFPLREMYHMSVQTAGALDSDSVLEASLSNVDTVTFKFKGEVDMAGLLRLMAQNIL